MVATHGQLLARQRCRRLGAWAASALLGCVLATGASAADRATARITLTILPPPVTRVQTLGAIKNQLSSPRSPSQQAAHQRIDASQAGVRYQIYSAI